MSSAKKKGKEEPAPVIVHTCKHINYEYNFLTTLNSMEELDDFRFKHHCQFGSAKGNFSRATLPCQNCGTKKTGCRYKLLVIRPNIGEKENEMHVYAYGEHNHALRPESERLSFRVMQKIKLMPDQNPPPTQRTPDGLEWTFQRTVDNFETLDKCRIEIGCRMSGHWKADANRRRLHCTKYTAGDTAENCPFSMLAMKTTKCHYHIYTHGQHNHASTNPSKNKCKSRKRRADSIDPGSESGEMEDAERKVDDEQEERMEEEGADEGENATPPIVKEYSLEKIQRRLGNSLRKGQAERAHKWMGRVDVEQIDGILTGMDLENVVKMMEMADQEMREDEKRSEFWLPWMRRTILLHGPKSDKAPILLKCWRTYHGL